MSNEVVNYNVKISYMPTASEINDSAYIPIIQNGSNYKVKPSAISGKFSYDGVVKFLGVQNEEGYIFTPRKDGDFDPTISIDGDPSNIKFANPNESFLTPNGIELIYTKNIDPDTKIEHPYVWKAIGNNAGQLNVSYVAPENPVNNDIWVDTSISASGYSRDAAETIASIRRAVCILQRQMFVLLGLRTNGIISGNVDDSALSEMTDAATPVQPSILDNPEYEGVEEIKPNYDNEDEITTKTVNHVSIKMGAWAAIQANTRHFINGELVWCTDRNKLYIYNQGIFYVIGSSGGDDDDMDEQTVRSLVRDQLSSYMGVDLTTTLVGSNYAYVKSIDFVPVGSSIPQYTVAVNEEGKLLCYDKSLDNREPAKGTGTLYYDDAKCKVGVMINSFYLGGEHTEHEYACPCSHNFIELSNPWIDKNGKGMDINLNGFYLFYLGSGKGISESLRWHKLKLWGTIPAGGTFLIRGAQCSVMDANTTLIKVDSYDMQWYDEEEKGEKPKADLIRFAQDAVAFYLAWCPDDDHVNYLNGTTSEEILFDNLPVSCQFIDVDNKACATGFIDLFSFNINAPCEKKTFKLPSAEGSKVSANDVIFRRWYMIDPVSQSQPADGIDKHNGVKYCTATFLDGATTSEYSNIAEMTPKASYQHKTISASRSLFSDKEPSTLTCSFGIQASDNSANGGDGATRCFCWNSINYYDEFIWIRKKTGTSQQSNEWNKVESLKKEYSADATNYPDLGGDLVLKIPRCFKSSTDSEKYYGRKRWETSYGQVVTTHKVIISGLEAGTYEYMVVRGTDESKLDSYYKSNVREFTVHTDADCVNFDFMQTTDQQGASWEEYEVWNLSAKFIKRKIDDNTVHDPRFLINTGDICYNGSRSNEWIDYFRGYAPLNNKEEMLTIGNNDLAPVSMMDLGNGGESPWKINPDVIDYFYTVEMDMDNPPIFEGTNAIDGEPRKSFYIPSLYSFNYGEYHFISILSEIRTLSSKDAWNPEGGKEIPENTVNLVFGIKDEQRTPENNRASKIYDYEEMWVVRDLMKWQGTDIRDIQMDNFNPYYFLEGDPTAPENSDKRKGYRYHSSIVGKCRKCFAFIHEMPFNIISTTSYQGYKDGALNPRESAKAYLNRLHNYEYQRSFKLWNISMIFGGHKHTCALTKPVYDAPQLYNPINQKIYEKVGNVYQIKNGNYSDKDNILNDNLLDSTGMFQGRSSFNPFIQVLKSEFNDLWNGNSPYIYSLKEYCNEVFNNSSSSITFTYTKLDDSIETVTLNAGEWKFFVGEAKLNELTGNDAPRCRVEIVDNISCPQYIMCQATGFKNKSNSDLAAESDKIGFIPWEFAYVPGENIAAQTFPFYTTYEVRGGTENKVIMKMYQIQNMYGTPGQDNSKAGYWDLMKIYNVSRDNHTLEAVRNTILSVCTNNLYGGTIEISL